MTAFLREALAPASLLIMEVLHATSRLRPAHNLWFALFTILSLLFFGKYLNALVTLSLRDGRYSHVLLIPIMSASLVYLQRRRVFSGSRYCPFKSLPLLVLGVTLFCLAQKFRTLNSNDRLSLVVLAIVVVWMAGFVLCYGPQSFRAALFPLLFLLWMIPIPTVVLDNIVLALQKGSAVMTYALFKVLGVPVFWQHFKFLLPGAEIEIAEECSGIRSSLALFITSILAGYVFLPSSWRRVVFSLFTVPVVHFQKCRQNCDYFVAWSLRGPRLFLWKTSSIWRSAVLACIVGDVSALIVRAPKRGE